MRWVWGDNDRVPNPAQPAERFPASALRAVAGFGVVGLGLSGWYATTGIGIPCPWRQLTGTLCPFCGATTMGSALLHGDLAAAWAANQFVFLLLCGVVVASAVWVVELLGGPGPRLPQRLRDQRAWYLVLGLAAVAFAVVRNLWSLG